MNGTAAIAMRDTLQNDTQVCRANNNMDEKKGKNTNTNTNTNTNKNTNKNTNTNTNTKDSGQIDIVFKPISLDGEQSTQEIKISSCLDGRRSTSNASVSFDVPDAARTPHHRFSISSKPVSSKSINSDSDVGSVPQQNNIHDSTSGSTITRTAGKPIRSKSNNSINNEVDGNDEDINNDINKLTLNAKNSIKPKEMESNNDNLEERDCAVQMPGDFFYLKPEQENNNNDDNISITSSDNNRRDEENNDQENKNNNTKVQSQPVEPNKILFTKQTYKDDIIPFTEYFEDQDDKKFHILIGATGSVATIKIPLIIDKLFNIYSRDKISIQLIVTKPAEHFLNGLKISSDVKIWREEDSNPIQDITKNNDRMLFHELSRWADIMLIAPLSANSLAKLANGICNNLLTSVVRDWSYIQSTPILVAPAMNTFMYINPMTKKHLAMLEENFPFLEILKPVEKVLICGDMGMGGMREWNDIVENLRLRIKEILRARNEDDKDNEDEENEDDEDNREDNDTDNEDEDDDDDTDVTQEDITDEDASDNDEDDDEENSSEDVQEKA